MDKHPTILIVDDDASVLMMMEKTLRREGYVVLAAKDGREGLELARNGKPALILLDVDLPDIGGGEVRRRLAEDPKTRDIPVIFVSGLVDHDESGKHDAAGNLFLSKPIEASDLLQAIKSRLKRPR